jgi:hypothetical protein
LNRGPSKVLEVERQFAHEVLSELKSLYYKGAKCTKKKKKEKWKKKSCASNIARKEN